MQKPIVYADVPEFDQLTQMVVRGEEVDMGDYISVGVKVMDVELEETDGVI